MSPTTRTIVIETGRAKYKHEVDEVFAVTLPQFGITGYGQTLVKAQNNCNKLFMRYIKYFVSHYQNNKLEQMLNRAGAKWHWEEAGNPQILSETPRPKLPNRLEISYGDVFAQARGHGPSLWGEKEEESARMTVMV